MREHIHTWQQDGFRLELFDTGQRKHPNHWRLAYEFYHNDVLVFEGDDFGCPQTTGIDSDQCVGSLLTFLALKPGDTDREYFEDYTEAQLAFAHAHGDELWQLAEELQNRERILEELLMSGPGHDGYAYNADVYCVDCGQAIIHKLSEEGKLPGTLEECCDTDVCPQPIFFGESPDCAQHCAECHEYLYGESPNAEEIES